MLILCLRIINTKKLAFYKIILIKKKNNKNKGSVNYTYYIFSLGFWNILRTKLMFK